MNLIESYEGAQLYRRGDIALLLVDNPPLNALSLHIRQAIVQATDKVEQAADLRAFVIACAGNTFFVGADIREFDAGPQPPLLREVVDRLLRCPKPVVAAIHGMALGGGLEIALACHYRITTANARLGLPEVNLGLIPGAGGLRLLPRLAGVRSSLELAAFGKPIKASKGYELGIVDRIVAEPVTDAAMSFVASEPGLPPRPATARDFPDAAAETCANFAQEHARKLGQRQAAVAVIDFVELAAGMSYDNAGEHEAQVFRKLRESAQSKALRYLFKAERLAAKSPRGDASAATVETVGILGAGTMGSGIAIACLRSGLRVKLHDPNPNALASGVSKIRTTLDMSLASGRMSDRAHRDAFCSFSLADGYEGFGDVDLVIEAAYEDMETKQAIFRNLARVARTDCIFATNTSYLSVDTIAKAGGRPDRSVGLHFFSPANIMRLLEVVQGAETSDVTLATALTLAKRLRKTPVIANNAPGFIGNRMFAVRKRETDVLLAAGTSPEAIDSALVEFGFAMGPCRVSDLTGLDLGWSKANSTGATIRERLCEAGRLGEKAQAGFYDYDENGKARPSEAAKAIIAGFASERGIAPQDISAEQIRARLIWPMVDEAAVLLAEGVAMRESDIDVVWVHGYGWPAWTGGPMFHARHHGLDQVIAELREMGKQPSPALLSLQDPAAD